MARKDGGPAYPINSIPYSTGMSLRDWFAGQALAGLCASRRAPDEDDVETAYELADAMLAERDA